MHATQTDTGQGRAANSSQHIPKSPAPPRPQATGRTSETGSPHDTLPRSNPPSPVPHGLGPRHLNKCHCWQRHGRTFSGDIATGGRRRRHGRCWSTSASGQAGSSAQQPRVPHACHGRFPWFWCCTPTHSKLAHVGMTPRTRALQHDEEQHYEYPRSQRAYRVRLGHHPEQEVLRPSFMHNEPLSYLR